MLCREKEFVILQMNRWLWNDFLIAENSIAESYYMKYLKHNENIDYLVSNLRFRSVFDFPGYIEVIVPS